MQEVEMYTDGAAKGNPGPGGYGVIIQYKENTGKLHEKTYADGYLKTTNNRMELMAAIVGLEALTRPCRVYLYSDSQYLVRAMNEHWIRIWKKNNWMTSKKTKVKNIDLWENLEAAAKQHVVSFIWIEGHAGHRENERCDKLAVKAAKRAVKEDDTIITVTEVQEEGNPPLIRCVTLDTQEAFNKTFWEEHKNHIILILTGGYKNQENKGFIKVYLSNGESRMVITENEVLEKGINRCLLYGLQSALKKVTDKHKKVYVLTTANLGFPKGGANRDKVQEITDYCHNSQIELEVITLLSGKKVLKDLICNWDV